MNRDPRRPRLASTASSPCKSNGRPEPGVPTSAGGFLVPPAGQHLGGLYYSREMRKLPSQRAYDGQRNGRGALPTESALVGANQCHRRLRSPPCSSVDSTQDEFRGSTMRPHPFASIRFHVLLNSLFKVLFNFPSRYLSAIGLMPVFSLRWSLPPTLGCIPKQPDS